MRKYAECRYTFRDEETREKHVLTADMLEPVVDKLFAPDFPRGLAPPPATAAGTTPR